MSDSANRSLEQLIEDERAISARRSRLHDRIDFLRSSGMSEPDAEERLAALLVQERAVSDERRALHVLIDARRDERGIAERGPATHEPTLEG